MWIFALITPQHSGHSCRELLPLLPIVIFVSKETRGHFSTERRMKRDLWLMTMWTVHIQEQSSKSSVDSLYSIVQANLSSLHLASVLN